ncbi:MAG: hypothetical protein WCF85_13760 [Rhodospirillaceae bacterium]
MNVPEKVISPDVTYPRVLVPGLKNVIAEFLSKREWQVLNDHGRFIFEYVGSDNDTVIIPQLKLNRAIQLLSQRIFIVLLSRFKSFNSKRMEFENIINRSMGECNYRLTDSDFCQIFEALFRDYHDLLQSQDGRLRLVISHSNDFVETLDGIFNAYFRFKESMVRSKKTLGNAKAR